MRELYRQVRQWWWVTVCGLDGVAYDDAEDGREAGDHEVVPTWRLPHGRSVDLERLDRDFRVGGEVADQVARGVAADLAKENP